MFKNCKNLVNLNISNLEAPIGRNMQEMFSGCESLESLNLSKLNTKYTVNMTEMFYNTLKLQNLDLSKFETPFIESFDRIFENINNNKEMTIIIDEDKCVNIKDSIPNYAKKVKPTQN